MLGHRFWNTDGWEVASRYQFKNSVKWQPEYAVILSILRDKRPSENPNTFIPQLSRSHWPCFR
jgi:hypothetical protein